MCGDHLRSLAESLKTFIDALKARFPSFSSSFSSSFFSSPSSAPFSWPFCRLETIRDLLERYETAFLPRALRKAKAAAWKKEVSVAERALGQGRERWT